jgi:hypothetical protein
MISVEELGKHNSRESCWIVVHGALAPYLHYARPMMIPGNVYDVTEFLDGMLALRSGISEAEAIVAQTIPVCY